MIVLSVDSSSLVTTVALLKDEYILGEYTLNFNQKSSLSRLLFSMVGVLSFHSIIDVI